MSTTNEDNILRDLVESIIDEALRGFNLAKFKATPGLDPKIAYAESVLPMMGMGSSRIVFALSGGKVLKIARNPKGLAQNEAEQDIYTDPNTKPVIARIFDADPNNEWVIAEIVQPLPANRAAWEAATGFDFATFGDVLNDWEDKGMPDENGYLQGIVQAWQARLNDLVLKGQQQGQLYKVTQRRLKNYIRIAKSPLVKGVMNLVRQGLVVADLAHLDKEKTSDNVIGHYGKTIDGRIVLLDYGYTGEVWAKHYDKNRPGATRDPNEPPPAAPANSTDTTNQVRFFSADDGNGQKAG